MVTCLPCARQGLRNFVFSSPGLLAHVPSRPRHLSYSLLPRKSSSYFCRELRLLLLGAGLSRTSYLHGWSLHLQDFPSKLPLTALCSGLGCPQKECEEQVAACLSIPEAHLISLFWSQGFSPLQLSPSLRPFLKSLLLLSHHFFLIFGFTIFQIESQNVRAGQRIILIQDSTLQMKKLRPRENGFTQVRQIEAE